MSAHPSKKKTNPTKTEKAKPMLQKTPTIDKADAKRNFITLRQKLAIAEYLKDKLHDEGGGYVRYKVEGMTDADVAREFNVTIANVSGVRNEVYGKLKPWSVKIGRQERIEAMDQSLKAMGLRVTETTFALDRRIAAVEEFLAQLGFERKDVR